MEFSRARALHRSVSSANAHVRVVYGLRVRTKMALGVGWNARLSRANRRALGREVRLRMRFSGGWELLHSCMIGTSLHLVSIRRIMERCGSFGTSFSFFFSAYFDLRKVNNE